MSQFAFVAECAGEVVGIATTTVHADEVEVEYLVRNHQARAARGVKVGPILLDAAAALAASVGALWLSVESLDEPRLLAFYEERGFTRAGPPRFDAFWGVLHPMRRPASWPVP